MTLLKVCEHLAHVGSYIIAIALFFSVTSIWSLKLIKLKNTRPVCLLKQAWLQMFCRFKIWLQ